MVIVKMNGKEVNTSDIELNEEIKKIIMSILDNN